MILSLESTRYCPIPPPQAYGFLPIFAGDLGKKNKILNPHPFLALRPLAGVLGNFFSNFIEITKKKK
jgi:hypothetical protein